MEMITNIKGIDKEFYDKAFYDKALEHKILRDKYSHVDGKLSLRNFVNFYKEAKEPIERQNPSTL